MHKLLQRQLRRTLRGDTSQVPRDFLQAVDLAYHQADEDRNLLERAMDLTSEELMERNQELRREVQEREGALAALKATLEATEEGILVVDSARRIVDCNTQFLEIFQQTWEQLADDDHGLGVAADATRDPEAFRQRVEEIYTDPEGASFDVLLLTDGRVIERTSAPQRVHGRTVGRVWSFRDVTVRQQLETRERQAQRMEAVGQLAGGVAHDFNNLLTVIQGFCDLAQRKVVDEPSDAAGEDSLARYLAQIFGAAERAAKLTSQLLALSHQQVLEVQPVDLDRRVHDLRPVFEKALGSMIQLEIEAGSDVVVATDPAGLEQILLNLVLNARDAMPAGGRLVLGFERRKEAGGDEVELTVRDTGSGIDPEVLPRIFEPFFTSKGLGKGTGLGLATVRGIVEQSGGSISVESEVGRGTLFRLRLPAAEPAPVSAPQDRYPLPPEPRSIRVLAVDDDPIVRLILLESLNVLGYQVLEAEGPDDCLARFSDAEFDVLLTDIVMPGMSGFELSRRLCRSRPDLKVLYVSGYDPEARERLGRPIADGHILPKPFDAKTLARKLQEVLAYQPVTL